jgi:hypothetical protein
MVWGQGWQMYCYVQGFQFFGLQVSEKRIKLAQKFRKDNVRSPFLQPDRSQIERPQYVVVGEIIRMTRFPKTLPDF